jgi:Cu-processing system permease protein
MAGIWVIAKMSLLENSRKQVFHVMCLLMLAVIASSTMLSIFTEGVQIKILKDLCMTCILFGGAALAIALGATGIPNDVESRTIHPLIARPLTRVQYLVGKFLGTFITVSLGVMAMAIAFGVLILMYQHSVDSSLGLALLFTLLEVAIVAAVATTISTFASPAITTVVTFMIYLAGTIKIGYIGGLIEKSQTGLSKTIYTLIYHALPNLECFNLKSSLVHHDVIPAAYLGQVAIYGVCYIAFALAVGASYFASREV